MTNFCCRNFHVIVPRTQPSDLMKIASYLGSKRIFKIFNSKWSYDEMLIDWVRSGRTGKYLALGQDVWTSLRSVRTPWPRAKYFPIWPSHSVNKYIISWLKENLSLRYLYLTALQNATVEILIAMICRWIRLIMMLCNKKNRNFARFSGQMTG